MLPIDVLKIKKNLNFQRYGFYSINDKPNQVYVRKKYTKSKSSFQNHPKTSFQPKTSFRLVKNLGVETYCKCFSRKW